MSYNHGNKLTLENGEETQAMPKILEKYELAPKTHYIKVDAPLVASHAKAGQFVIVRVHQTGERVPFTIADIDTEAGTITLVVQEVGKTSMEVGALKQGDEIRDLLGPLGTASEVEKFGTVVLMGGGFGNAAIHLLGKALKKEGNKIITIIGARNKELLIMENELAKVSDELIIMTDDGSYGRQGLVTQPLKEMLESGKEINRVVAVGPIPMMRAVGETTRPFGVKTIVSLNPIMVDGTGMCGGCRVTIAGETHFACTDGPEFDAHQVDFNELVKRTRMYKPQEQHALEECRLNKKINELSKEAAKAGGK
jgi:ferredoxin--NADP+ reductase